MRYAKFKDVNSHRKAIIMKENKVLHYKATCLAAIIFVAIAPISFCMAWFPVWAVAMAALAIAVAVRQFLVGKVIDIFAAIIILGGLAITNYPFELYSPLITAILLIVGGVYIFIRQCFAIYAEKRYKQEQSTSSPSIKSSKIFDDHHNNNEDK